MGVKVWGDGITRRLRRGSGPTGKETRILQTNLGSKSAPFGASASTLPYVTYHSVSYAGHSMSPDKGE